MNAYRGKHVSAAARRASPSFHRGRHQVRYPHRRRSLIIGLILIVLILLYPLLEARLILTDRVTIRSDDLPAEANNLRIVYLSDIHYGFWFTDADVSRLVSKINNLRPDLVLLGGDYGTDNASAVDFFVSLRKQGTLHSRYGVYGVIGEMDRGESAADLTKLTESMSNAGVTPLVNKVAAVNVASNRIYIAGVDDYIAGDPNFRTVAGSVSAQDYVIFLSHNPSAISDAQLATDSSGTLGWFDLGLFGHTHGGQMKIFGSLLDIAEDVPDRYRGGWLKENRVDLLISRGVGTILYPGRLFCFPQIHYITVTN